MVQFCRQAIAFAAKRTLPIAPVKRLCTSFQGRRALLIGRDLALMEMEQKRGPVSVRLFLVTKVQWAFMAHLLLFVFAFLVSFGSKTRGSTVEFLHECC